MRRQPAERRSHRASIPVWLLALMAVGLVDGQVNAQVVQLSREELIQQSALIVVGEVISQQARWNGQGSMIVTDYRIRVDDVLFGESPGVLTLTFAGGQLPEEGQAVSLVPVLTVGELALLMLEETATPLLSPIAGVYQGRFTASARGGAEPVALDGRGAEVDVDGGPIPFFEFVTLVRQEIPEAKARPQPDRTIPESLRSTLLDTLPSQAYDADARYSEPTNLRRPLRAPVTTQQLPASPATAVGLAPASLNGPDTGDTSGDAPITRWSYSHRAKTVPILYNSLPDDGSQLSNHDQFQMAYWNDYADIFRVMASTGTWAWMNDRYDIAGYVTNATMLDQFGAGWGATTLAINWKRWDGTGFSIESDIAMNPAFAWTTDDYTTYSNPILYNADRTLLHKIGHSWGLDHQFNALSVMNYAPHKYRAYTDLYRDDVAAVRSAFPSESVSGQDLGVALFYASGFQD